MPGGCILHLLIVKKGGIHTLSTERLMEGAIHFDSISVGLPGVVSTKSKVRSNNFSC